MLDAAAMDGDMDGKGVIHPAKQLLQFRLKSRDGAGEDLPPMPCQTPQSRGFTLCRRFFSSRNLVEGKSSPPLAVL